MLSSTRETGREAYSDASNAPRFSLQHRACRALSDGATERDAADQQLSKSLVLILPWLLHARAFPKRRTGH